MAVYLRQGHMYRHDFAVLTTFLLPSPSYQHGAQILINAYPIYTCIFVCCLIQTNKIFEQVLEIFWKTIRLVNRCNNDNSSSLPTTPPASSQFLGGGKSHLTYKFLFPYILFGCAETSDDTEYKFVSYLPLEHAADVTSKNLTWLVCRIPLTTIIDHITQGQAKLVAKTHGISVTRNAQLHTILQALREHQCSQHCYNHVFVFKPTPTKQQASCKVKKPATAEIKAAKKKAYKQTLYYKKKRSIENKNAYKTRKQQKFPPNPPGDQLLHKIITGFCQDTHPLQFEESGCAVCGKLTPLRDLIKKSEITCSLDCLKRSGVTAIERTSEHEAIQEITDPIVDPDCHSICLSCHKHLIKGIAPPMALANGLWLGHTPDELKSLTFAERILVSRVRHNRCIIRIASGRYKMKANAISFQNPIPKIYDVLPPPLEELDQILACIFTGPCQPTDQDIERTPMLVRRKHVGKALKWLKLNHSDYQDIEISEENLIMYPIKSTPVIIDYRESVLNKNKEATSVHDNDEEDGVETGDCPFVVHGLTGEDFSQMTLEAIKAKALEHLLNNGKIMFVGHAQQPESIYNNPQLFPSMMPWLFPYGKGGICNELHQGRLSSIAHKQHLLMYYDKRFQTDPAFALIALNHEQIQECATGGYLTANKAYFADIVNRLHNIDLQVLSDISRRLSQNIHVKPETEAEKLCYKLLKDLDIVGGYVKGSISSKKYMRNEIRSLISYLGAPTWFITLSPADNKHPICLYFADTQEKFKPDIRLPDETLRLVSNNPVAAARFFDFMCKAFIKHVLGVDKQHAGIFGETSAYYGTVEQQGRLTLHLHMLIWIKNALSPQEIRDNILNRTSDFQEMMVKYLEGVHQGEFFNGDLSYISTQVKESQHSDKLYIDPTKTMPEQPPQLCNKQDCNTCNDCIKLQGWWPKFKQTVDDIIFRSNVHSCRISIKDKNGNDFRKGCLNNKGQCRARFPRDVVSETLVDPLTGALKIKKGEAWLNMFTPVISYLFRCNSDTTSLLSGTAFKAAIVYITDYITKPGLSTYVMFDTIQRIFNRNADAINSSSDRKNIARLLMTKIINALTAKIEIGSPMASMYLLGNPDHYKKHEFVNFYWRNYVQEVQSAWQDVNENEAPAKVVLNKISGKVIGLCNVQDYVYRPHAYHNMNLYNWIQQATKKKRSKAQQEIFDDKHAEEYEQDNYYDPDMLEDDELDVLNNPEHANHTAGGIGEDAMEVDDNSSNNDLQSETSDDELMLADGELYDNELDSHSFMKSHPQFRTHSVSCTDNGYVPNFLGGSLPRCDQGNREYYCLTMLTLFKPWKTGKDLKLAELTWDETFIQHNFTSEQQQLMKNFNLHYECKDARDDYSAKLKNNENDSKMFPSWASNDVLKDLDQNKLIEDDDDLLPDTSDESIYLDPSHAYLKRLQEMDAIENVVQNAGWLDACPEPVDQIDSSFKPQVQLASKQWNAIVKDAKEDIMQAKVKHLSAKVEDEMPGQSHDCNTVVVDDISYLRKDFHAEKLDQQKVIDDTVIEFSLNKEQDRAFRIVANHATLSQSGQLNMYLGGMGGTGKSQVIKALISFFAKRNESHRIMVLAPTGSAAALLNGSTYHSVLGINSTQEKESVRNEHTVIAQVKERLQGVDYIFLDEISMVACHELYLICARIAKARNVADLPFGGINMIFAGDFAQLPPVAAPSLYQETVGTSVNAAQTLRGQQSAIGKALWHQVTTVVILRQNMRQKTQSENDSKLRTALENMRYATCTPEDISFLRTRIAGNKPGKPKLSDKQFRNVSIITALNAQKDRINYLGSERFASETGQRLTNFFSIDHFGAEHDPSVEKKRMRKKRTLNNGEIDPIFRNILWNLNHSATDHVPGKLSLCIGLPVMIRNNDATELCITKGQEGHVLGWQSEIGPNGQLVLDTLFVKLDKPAKIINLKGLPENVVPLTKMGKTINCVTPSNLAVRINRSQVPVMPNFAMTDYASQGKSRVINVVDLNSSRDHRSIYTALSRSTSSDGTVIIQGFNEKKITCGASGYLRQEFRELELLNEITKLRYEGTLPKAINGHLRNPLIRQFQIYKTPDYVPPEIPGQIKWTASDPFDILPIITDSPWQIIDSKKINTKYTSNTDAYVTAKGTTAVTNVSSEKKRKHKLDDEPAAEPSPLKKKTRKDSFVTMQETPVGFIWNSENYSCAYDAVFTILCDMWLQNTVKWTRIFGWISKPLEKLAYNYHQVLNSKMSLEAARNDVRKILHDSNNNAFPYGQVGTNIADLAKVLFTGHQIWSSAKQICGNCNTQVALNEVSDNILYVANQPFGTLNDWFQKWQNKPSQTCNTCKEPQQIIRTFSVPPEVLIFSLNGNIGISKTIRVQSNNNSNVSVLPLKGVVYLGDFHFTCRLISNKDVWFHDGMTTKRTCEKQGHITDFNNENLMHCNNKVAVLAIYAKK